MAEVHSIENAIPCPVCNGNGSLKETYPYKAEHKYDAGGQSIQRSERCWFCEGEGGITPDKLNQWKLFETYSICPQCGGTGGKRYWSWEEDEQGTHKEFTFIPCRVCGGKQRVSPEQAQAHHQERQRLRLWGVGCTALVVVFGIGAAMVVLSALVRGTPWLRCCPAPGLIPVGIVLLQFARRRHDDL